MPARLFCCAVQQLLAAMDEGEAMTSGDRRFGTRLVLPAVVLAGLSAWLLLPGSSDAESQPAPVPLSAPSQNTSPNESWFNPVITPTQATLATPAGDTAPADAALAVPAAPIDGLSIASQSFRRGGLGSKALVTFTLRNRNEYAVRDIEIFCAFTQKDGSHLTSRKRTIHDTVNTRSQRTFPRMLVGFVNIRAEKAKCSLVTANRI
jgi:hypothetical protein